MCCWMVLLMHGPALSQRFLDRFLSRSMHGSLIHGAWRRYPYAAMITKADGRYLCVGSLVHPRWVMIKCTKAPANVALVVGRKDERKKERRGLMT